MNLQHKQKENVLDYKRVVSEFEIAVWHNNKSQKKSSANHFELFGSVKFIPPFKDWPRKVMNSFIHKTLLHMMSIWKHNNYFFQPKIILQFNHFTLKIKIYLERFVSVEKCYLCVCCLEMTLHIAHFT